ncbi:glycosyltransferase 1 domain-containing protein 1-like isoform X1 [Biomphalaria glabrata]|nr:glycosyltransferase 1 domain-containing protein 1-like isoform X1 [Biomphalaria glabrata]
MDEFQIISHRFPRGMPHTLILLSPLAKRGGNYCTIKRIRNHLKSIGYKCHLEDPKLFQNHDEFVRMVDEDNIGILIGIHALRTGAFMKESNLPYIVILGGTDINEFSKDSHSLDIMTEVITKAKFVVCFSSTIRDKALALWPNISLSKLALIPQAVHTCVSSFNLMSYLFSQPEVNSLMTSSFQKPVVFSLIGGIRPVKNSTYLIPTFQEWHARDKRILLLIVGPKLDEHYCSTVFEPAVNKRPGVVYIPGLPMEDTHAIMSQSFAVVNSSDSEGMCLAILEAMHIGVPVLARNIPGNKAIVQDGVTGLLYDSPQEFIEKAESLTQCPDAYVTLTKNAKEYVHTYHNLEDERKKYVSLVECCIKDILASVSTVAKSVPVHGDIIA